MLAHQRAGANISSEPPLQQALEAAKEAYLALGRAVTAEDSLEARSHLHRAKVWASVLDHRVELL
jgi:hypothetical protein